MDVDREILEDTQQGVHSLITAAILKTTSRVKRVKESDVVTEEERGEEDINVYKGVEEGYVVSRDESRVVGDGMESAIEAFGENEVINNMI